MELRKRFCAFAEWHVWVDLTTAELFVLHTAECPIQTHLFGTEAYIFLDCEYLGEL